MADSDFRVQAIRCCGCGRLCPYGDTVGTLHCVCGHEKFYPSFPFPDEEGWALMIYRKELEEAGLWAPSLSAKTWNR